MTAFRKLFVATVAVALCALALSASSQTSQKWTPDAVLSLMDHAAQDFHSLSANIEESKYTDVVKDTSIESGQIWVRKDEKTRIQFTKPDTRTILRTGMTLYIFNPKLNRVEEFDLKDKQEMVDQYLDLGFNTRGEHLKKNFLIAVVNNEQDLDGHKTVVIELTPKSTKTREQITKIQMWVDTSSWMAIQQKFFEANSGDYFIIHYTSVTKNLKIDDARFKQDWPKGATKVKPRG